MAQMASEKLSDLAVKKQKKPGLYADGKGLYLQVAAGADAVTKSWIFRFKRQNIAGGRARKMGLGPYPELSLAEARDRAREAYRQLLDGVDPIAARKSKLMAARLSAARSKTFKECAEEYIRDHEATWKNGKHRAQWRSSLKNYAYPVFGSFPVAEIDLALILKAIKPIWHEKPETASRVRGRIETVLGWATVHGLREGDNPARWRGHLDNILPARAKVKRVEHHAALRYLDLPAFMIKLRAMDAVSARALEFAILTITRTNETLRACRTEIDLENRMWVIPPERMKAGREHRVPLSTRAMEIIADAPTEKKNPYLFIGAQGGKPLSDMSMLMLLRRMGYEGTTVHGFRSTFKDWCSEQTAYPNELGEIALAHIVSDKTEAAYRRGDMLVKRRRLMDDWARFCASSPIAGEITPLKAAQ